MLAEHPAGYRAQPYQQLAKVHRAAGHERDARRILIAQQRDLRRRGDIGGPFRRLVHRLSGVLIGYGYRPWRPLAGLLATVFLALLLTFGAGAGNMSTHSPGRPPGACTAVENVGFAVDLAVPLVKTGGSQRCEFDVTKLAGQWYLAGGWFAQVLGWAFATLFVAGYTGLVRKSS